MKTRNEIGLLHDMLDAVLNGEIEKVVFADDRGRENAIAVKACLC